MAFLILTHVIPVCRLTPPEILSLQDTGPFTRDPHRVKFILDPDNCRANLDKWMLESMGFLKQAMRRSNITDPRLLSVAKIARSQAGRPQVDPGGRTHFDILKPLLNVDTKSHADGVEIVDYCFDNLLPGDPAAQQVALMFDALPLNVSRRMCDPLAARMAPVAVLCRGDGQSLVTISRERKIHKSTTDTFPRVVPVNGGFHSCGHFSFGCNEGFHDMKYGRTKTLLSKEKVPKHIPNFENDSYMHCTTHIRDDLIGTLAYFLRHVQKPAPELLLDDPVAYLGQIKSAGGVAAFESMRYSGIPGSHYIRCARASEGEKVPELEAYAFHVMRAWAHKPVEAKILLISLLSTEATHPKIADVVKHSQFFSALGREGSSMFLDRALEGVNLYQDQRRGKFSAFETALEYTPAMSAFMHVFHALEAAEHGDNAASDPLRESTINAANVICEDLVKRLGVDLTIPDETNPLFHTGGAPNVVRSTSGLSHRPEEFIWRVALGQSLGAGRGGKPEHWARYVDRFIPMIM